ncbi:MAG: hypothetical protein ACM3PU_14725 [Gemmatimonadota bacterium]
MVESAKEARERAETVKGAHHLVNQAAAEPLIEAAERGEMSAAVPTARLQLVPAAGLMGHIYDIELADALDAAGHRAMALGVRKLVALGFSVASTVIEGDAATGDDDASRRRISIEGLRLGFATAEEMDAQRLAIPLLVGVVLPPAHHWRRRATSVQTVRKIEERVLAQIALEIERGATRCRLDARKLVGGGLRGEIGERLTTALRARGFTADVSSSGNQLNVRWDS